MAAQLLGRAGSRQYSSYFASTAGTCEGSVCSTRPCRRQPGRQPNNAPDFGHLDWKLTLRGRSLVCSVADLQKGPAPLTAENTHGTVSIDSSSNPEFTVVSIRSHDRPGLLSAVTAAFRDLGVEVRKAEVDGTNDEVEDRFYVTEPSGEKLSESASENARKALEGLLGGQKLGRRPNVGGQDRAADKQKALLYSLLDTYIQNDVLSIEESIVSHVEYTLARNRYNFDDLEAYQATSFSLRDRLIQSWNDTQQYFKDADPKRVYYLSMEFLMGRSLTNALNNLGVVSQYTEALREMGYNLETIKEQERDAALGNGGLGRLAACFLDSMAATNLPAWGYGLRYQYGMFRQTIVDGFQHEQPDYWLNFGNPWEIERLNVGYTIKFYGHVSVQEEAGRQVFKWIPGDSVSAVAYDNPIPGFQTNNTINLRLWAAKPDREFDLQAFNTGDYVQAILARQRAETLSSVLYPDDRTYQGKELRLKQQHFFVSATMQDVIRRYKETHDDFEHFADKVSFQLNDTHPTIAVPELMRLLMDDNALGWTKAWEIVNKVFAFTNHTVLPEALERWPVSLIEKLLPRHMQIIYDINWRFLQQLRSMRGDDMDLMGRTSIIEEGERGEKFVRMAYLAVIASHTINGVAAIHSEIIKQSVFKDFADLWPHKFQNKTNGVTPRRWLAFCNPPLRALISRTLGDDLWINKLTRLTELRQHADDEKFQADWRQVKQVAKEAAIRRIAGMTNTNISADALLDIQVKRIHEYKRQLLNVLGIIHRYDELRKMSAEQRKEVVPRVCVIGGKAAPGYEMAKRIIKLITAVGVVVNNDASIDGLLKVVFVQDYNVSLAEAIIPGSDVSQHISTAGTEASGTGNMKFAMNGSLIIGTMDGANVEIAEEIGEDNMFIFGHRAHEIAGLRSERHKFKPDARFLHVVELVRKGTFGWEDFFEPLMESITTGGDFYLLANDFPSYIDVQAQVDEAYKDKARWTRMSINSVAGSGKFSSDRTILEYASDIWNVEPCYVPAP